MSLCKNSLEIKSKMYSVHNGVARSTVSYRLDSRATGFRSPAEAEDFSSSLFVQTSCEVHPASYPIGYRGPFRGVKHGRVVTLTTHLHLVPRSRISGSYTSCLPCCLHGGSGMALLLCGEINLNFNIGSDS
jgi:hypothetical protein